MQSYKIFFK